MLSLLCSLFSILAILGVYCSHSRKICVILIAYRDFRTHLRLFVELFAHVRSLRSFCGIWRLNKSLSAAILALNLSFLHLFCSRARGNDREIVCNVFLGCSCFIFHPKLVCLTVGTMKIVAWIYVLLLWRVTFFLQDIALSSLVSLILLVNFTKHLAQALIEIVCVGEIALWHLWYLLEFIYD